MINIIHIVGASGSGTSTLGQALEQKHGYKWIDTDEYFWQKTDPPFVKPLPREERIKLMNEEMQKNPKCVISGSLCGWGDIFIPMFDIVIFLETPAEIRIERLKKRESERFGKRIREGGDMFEEHLKFISWALSYDTGSLEMRSRALHENWLSACTCPVIRLNGSKTIVELINKITETISCGTKIK